MLFVPPSLPSPFCRSTAIRSDVGPHIQSVGEACLSLVRLPGVVARGTDQGNGTVLDETGGLRSVQHGG